MFFEEDGPARANSSAGKSFEYSKNVMKSVLFEDNEQERQAWCTSPKKKILLLILTHMDYHFIHILVIQLTLRSFMCQAL